MFVHDASLGLYGAVLILATDIYYTVKLPRFSTVRSRNIVCFSTMWYLYNNKTVLNTTDRSCLYTMLRYACTAQCLNSAQ